MTLVLLLTRCVTHCTEKKTGAKASMLIHVRAIDYFILKPLALPLFYDSDSLFVYRVTSLGDIMEVDILV